MTSTTTSASPRAQQEQKQKQKHQHQQPNAPLRKRIKGHDGQRSFRIKKCPKFLLAYNIISTLLYFCWLPDFIVALKDVSVTIPQAVKRGSNAMLTCNYDMENDTLYSVKWYKGRREFYRYTPKENPAMKVFPSQSGLNVERNLSNQSHVVLLAVPLNVSGKFTCEISVEAPSFQTAMVSGEMEVVELPEEQATVTGIQPRYRIGDLVDGNCSIKYSKPAANLTWTINGIVVPPHHIKTYQIEKYEEINLESVMSAVHFMVTNQHFIKGQMRLKCTASIFGIFKEEIESVIEEDRPRIMASGQSYPPDHSYGIHGDSDGYEHNESYLTYFSAPKSSASPTADFVFSKMIRIIKQKILNHFQMLLPVIIKTNTNTNTNTNTITKTQCVLTRPIVNNFESSLAPNYSIKIKTTYCYPLRSILRRFITTVLVILILVVLSQMIQGKVLTKWLGNKMTQDRQRAYNCIENFRQMVRKQKENFVAINLWHEETQYSRRNVKVQQIANGNYYHNASGDNCQTKCGQRQRQRQRQRQEQHQYQQEKHCLVTTQNVVNEQKFYPNYTDVNIINKNRSKKYIATTTPTTIKATTPIDCQHQMSQTFAFVAALPPPITYSWWVLFRLPPSSSLSSCMRPTSLSPSPTSPSSSLSLLLSNAITGTMGCRKKYVHNSCSLPVFAVDASKSNNAKYMSKDQILLMTFTAAAAATYIVAAAPHAHHAPHASHATSNSLYKTQSAFAAFRPAVTEALGALVLESELLQTSVHTSLPIAFVDTNSSNSPPAPPIFSRSICLMSFIGELLLRQC